MLDQAWYPIYRVPELKPLLMVIIYSIYTAVCYFIVEFGGFVLMAAVVANFPEFVNAF